MANKIKQYSFKSDQPKVYLIATPIGNLQEMTPRAIDVIKNNVQKIYCEDTRNTLKLLNYFKLKKKLVSLNKENEMTRFTEMVNDLTANLSIAIISDAGYPLISDPGYYAVHKILTEYPYDVVSISGANAALNAIVSSGLNPKHFLFFGFLEKIKTKKINELEQIAKLPYPIIFYEAPHRLLETLKLILTILGNRKIAVGKELTKIHEQWYRGSCQEVLTFLVDKENVAFGEYVIVVDGFTAEPKAVIADEVLFYEIDQLIKNENYRVKQAIDFVASKYQISKNILYNKYHHYKE
ncbi:16S rRNA (cytidine(1402)-2'-O)-methyltransferase [Spiroplasma sp. SV19]|uniref:16S rRNA (cytidine(1402)-2'-O)-methyltransferase n=1 Tax=Spiroplasma sp. SV19 TaxID=2570468 RepID=UPI0024B7B8B5|nr:16S rRNA (cytidine(1402)-2'-O)-methyltransferase [Spiroplasma sp. SV19]WHQ36926.1 16S rRNA (cytidine(1402)-2'-O)-methyltransferase [Spiroplasma sp. SV19]